MKSSVLVSIFFIFFASKECSPSSSFTESDLEILLVLNSQLHLKFFVFTEEPDLLTIKLLSRMNIFSSPFSLRKLKDMRNENFARTLLIKKNIQGFNYYLKEAENRAGLFPSLLVFDDSVKLEDLKKVDVPLDLRIFFVQSAELIYEKSGFEKEKQISNTSNNGIQISIKGNGNLNFHGTVLSLALVSEIPCRKIEEQHVFQKIRCFHQDIFDLMSDRLNFTKKIIECKDKENPYVFPNGSYSGLFKMLLNKDVDASSGSFVVSTKRLLSYDFVWPTFVLKTMMYVKLGKIDTYWQAYWMPFETKVWFAIMGYISASGTAFFLLRHFNRKYLEAARSTHSDAFDSFLTSFRIFCYQARFEVSDARSAKILQLATSFAVTILLTVYSGSISSSLTVHKPVLPFFDLDGFFVSGKYKITAISDSFIPYFFKEEYFPKKKISEKDFLIEFDKLPKNDRQGMDTICDGISAYVGIRENVRGLRQTKCNGIEIPGPIFLQHLAIGLPKHSPFREDLNRELNHFRSSGLLKRMELAFDRDLTNGPLQVEEEIPSVAVREIISSLIFLLTGYCASWILLLVEIKFRSEKKGTFIFRSRRWARKRRKSIRFIAAPVESHLWEIID